MHVHPWCGIARLVFVHEAMRPCFHVVPVVVRRKRIHTCLSDLAVQSIQGKLRAKVPAKSSNLNFEGYSLEFVRMEIWYKLKYTHSWFGTRKNMRQRMYHFIILTHVTKLFDGYFWHLHLARKLWHVPFFLCVRINDHIRISKSPPQIQHILNLQGRGARKGKLNDANYCNFVSF